MTRSEAQRYDHLVKVLTSERFLQKIGVNEVPFFICPHDASEAFAMEAGRRQLIRTLAQHNIVVLDLNLFDISLDLLKERGILDEVLAAEPDLGKDELLELLQGVLDTSEHLIPRVGAAIEEHEHDVIFLSGVGEVFPFIRAQNVLNNLQSTAKDRPTVMFFPGEYSHSLEVGASLNLFGKLPDDRYYRAFNIMKFEV